MNLFLKYVSVIVLAAAALTAVAQSRSAPELRVTGIVVDEYGHPISGAHLSHFSSAQSPVNSPSDETASPTVVTSRSGSFVLSAAANRNETFLVEAAGYAPVLTAADQLGGRTEKVVVMKRGASLTVRWLSSPNGHTGGVSLIPLDVDLPVGLSRERAIHLWTRPVSGTAQRWDSLPAGTYRIILRPDDAMPGSDTPAELAEVVLAPGDDDSVSVPRIPVQSEIGARMSIPIRVEAPDPEMLSGVSVTEWRGGFQAALPVKVHRDGNALVLTAEADCRAGSALVFESPKGIGVASLDEHCSAGVHVRLSIRSDVSAHFVTPRGAPRPRWGMIRLGRCGVEGQTIEVPFAIHQDLLQTAVPAECGGVSLYVAGYAPIHPAVQEIRGGTSYDLGVLTLRPGAAVVLRVRSGRRGDPLEGVRVTAVRASQLAAVRGTLNLESLSLGSAVTNAAGWARLTGLPDDRLVFLLNARGRKYPQMSEEYELPAGNETVIDDVILQPAANILVTLSVPDRLRDVVSLDAVELGATDDMRWPAHVPIRADLTPAGAVLADVPPGRYRLHATGRIKQGFALRVGEADITVTSGVDQTVPLTLNGSLYSGRVTRSGLAVAGTINLKPADRSTSRRPSVARLDTDGDFYVLLDGPGKYSVYVQTPNHDSVTLGEYVEFGDAGAPVEIELPAGRLTGRVVDSAGTAVTGVIVTARQNVAEPAAEVAGLAGEDGSFTLEGVSSGAWEVSAESQSERSEPLLVAIEDDDVEGITLVVDPTYSVNLRVIDVGGEPLRDVFVTAEFPRVGAEPKVYGGGSRLNGEVNFRLARSEQSKPTNVVLRANDGRLACETLTLNHDQIIQLPSFTGAARIVIAAGFTEAGARNWLIAPSGCAVPFVVRPEMESGGEESMLFRRLVPGEWRFVQSHSPEELAAVLAGRGALLAPIKRFVVARGITTRVPVSPAN